MYDFIDSGPILNISFVSVTLAINKPAYNGPICTEVSKGRSINFNLLQLIKTVML